ncbi:protein FAM234A [Esox lucius]|uniref:FAM234A/B beta-propeller domain-containing protein n=1 Tax=Esox lucius TaxID=8010 RepID=A0A6Q2Y2J6_ESOLU|nr:protein FAM234A [Esox lucius]XP_019901770.3 protein FAM234A [Esox lucius]XP_034148361.1 protein FAM234A [Esox lucius]
MEPADHATEVDPLQKDGVEGGGAAPAGQTKKRSLGLAKLTHWRTAAFFLSLFLGLTIVFAFSFIIPCPVRPQYLALWNRTFPEAATYDFLAIEDASKDKVKDVLFVLKDTEGSQNISCLDAGLETPCVYVSALAGTSGETLWERPLAPEFHWAQCGLGDVGGVCLVSHSKQLTAINKYTGLVTWTRPQLYNLRSTLPVLSVPDLDGDGISDMALVYPNPTQTLLVILSGKTGDQIGSEVVLETAEITLHLLHSTGRGSDYVLLQKDSGLYAMALWKIAAQAKAGVEKGLKKDKQWESKASDFSGLVTIYESDSLSRVLRTGKPGGVSNLLLVTRSSVEMLDGDSLSSLWRVNTSTILSEPSFGHFNKDGTPDIVVEEDIGNRTKRVIILDGMTGATLWEVKLMASPNSPKPASVHTINSFSVFMFWGLIPSEVNSTSLSGLERRSYLLYPHYSRVLLEKSNVLDHIIAFKATLLERGRHACYILLTGHEGATGTVVLSKRKLKLDVPDSRVLHIGFMSSQDTDKDIKEAFQRLRFSAE